MNRVTDFRVGELRIPAKAFPLSAGVEERLRLYAGPGRWEGACAVFEIAAYRLEELEAAMARDDAGVSR